MKLQAIIKAVNIKNSDTDKYITLKLEVSSEGLDLTELTNMSHKSLTMTLSPE